MTTAPVVGIDLGTTNTCIAIVEDGVPTVIPNKGGYRTTPSIVAISETGKRLVGHIAKRQAVTNARNTIYAVKRLIGRRMDAPSTKTVIANVPYTIVEGPSGDPRVELHGEVYSIPEISSFVLQEMRLVAEQYVGAPVEKAVITVPAYFNDNQRQATKDAGRIAGLDVIRIINEPTAAALAYGFGRDIERRVAVYDLGGGTFDISILDIGHGVFEVVATAGDTFLGGEDFDLRVMDWLLSRFQEQTGADVRSDRMALQRVKDAAEKARCELSEVHETQVDLPFFFTDVSGNSLHLQQTLTRATLEELTADLVERTIEICRRTIEQAGVDKDDLDDIILVGGMTRMPLVRKRVSEFFGRDPCQGVHPDEVVALGAAIQGAALVEDARDVLLLDVTPHSLGIMIAGGGFHRIIEQNTTVPTSATHTFTTVRDNQTTVKILVLQGESDVARDNELLGEFILSGLRKAPKGEVEIEVTFSISADGIVSVSAKDLETGKEQSITVTATSGLTEEEIQQMMESSRAYMVEARASEAVERERQKVEALVEEIEQLFPRVEQVMSGTSFGRDAIAKARAAVDRAKEEMGGNDVVALQEIAASLERTRKMFRGVVNKAGAS